MENIPFDPKEMQPIGEWPGEIPGTPGTPIFHSPVTAKENIRRYLSGKPPYWMPFFSEFKMFAPSVLPDNIARGSVFEGVFDPALPRGGKDYFGVEWEYQKETRGSMVRPGNPLVKDIEHWERDVVFPDLDSYDWEGSAKMNAGFLNDTRAIKMPVMSGLFERLVSFVGMEEALIALIDEDVKPSVHRLFERLCVFYDDLFERLAQWFKPDVIWFHDDWGSQRAPLFSYETCEEMILPYLKKVVESAHKKGLFVEFHSCGKNEILVPLMAASGADMWDGQALNDIHAVYEKCGKDIKLELHLPILPKDTPEETLREVVRALLDDFPQNCYIGMSHGLDPRYYPLVYEESRKRYSNR